MCERSCVKEELSFLDYSFRDKTITGKQIHKNVPLKQPVWQFDLRKYLRVEEKLMETSGIHTFF